MIPPRDVDGELLEERGRGPPERSLGERAAAEERGETVIVVGHQPDCSRIAAALAGGVEPAFPPGGMLAIELS